MKNILTITSILLLMHSCKIDKITTLPPPQNEKLMDSFFLKFPIRKTQNREIRCYLSSYKHYATRVLVFRQPKPNGGWLCYSLTYCRGPLSGNNLESWNEQIVSPIIWHNLKKWNIITLPDESIARKRWKTSKKSISLYMHGTTYYFEVFAKGRLTNRYTYDNPFEELANWDIKNDELSQVTNILTLLDKEYNFNNKDKSCELMAGIPPNLPSASSTIEQSFKIGKK